MTIAVGDALPEATFRTMTMDGPAELRSTELFSGKVALFAVPGAFTNTCSAIHLPGFVEHAEALKAKGVDRIVCVSVNDPAVMKAWAASAGADTAGIVMASDPHSAFTKAVGLELGDQGFGLRSKRYSMLIEDGVLRRLAVEETPATADASGAEPLLAAL